MKLAAVFFVMVVILLNTAQPSTGIRCMKCSNARTYGECDRKGRIVRCLNNQDSCQTEVRKFGAPGKYYTVIRKTCKSSRSCNQNYRQNPRGAWDPTQCNLNAFNSVCRCCCGTNSCNIGKGACFGGCATTHRRPDHASMSCTRGSGPGSECRFSCDYGYELIGSNKSRCEGKQWSSPAPSCSPLSCQPNVTSIANGNFWCTRQNAVGSVCRFTCNDGYRLSRSAPGLMICRHKNNVANWHKAQPTCNAVVVSPSLDTILQNQPEEGLNAYGSCGEPPELSRATKTCSDVVHNIGSTCVYKCDPGLASKGTMRTVCEEGGSWSDHQSVCEARCSTRLAPDHGDIECEGVGVGQSCSYLCSKGYVMKGSPTVKCIDAQERDPRWSNEAPQCLPEPHCESNMVQVDHGKAQCSRSVYTEGTVCSFMCDATHILVGSERLSCVREDDGNEDSLTWQGEPPRCEIKRCPEQLLHHGLVSCTNGTFVGSECSFSCDENYFLATESLDKNKCLPSQVYDGQAACCEPLCPPIVPGNLLVLIEASNEMNLKDWNGFISIVIDLLGRLVLGDESLRVAVLPFSSETKHSHFINFTGNAEMLSHRLRKMKFRHLRGETTLHSVLQSLPLYFENLEPRTGKLKSQQSSVIVFTTSKTPTHDNRNLITVAADALRQDYEVLAAGYNDSGGNAEELLSSIAGEGSYALLRRGRCVSLWTDQVLQLITNRLCRNRSCFQ